MYDLVSGNVNKVMYQHEQSDRFYHKYEYDADNRVTAAYTSYDDRTWDRDAKYFYYKHGPLSRTEIGDAKVQGMDYAYTLQGWIKAVNSNSLNVAHDMGQDGNSSVNAYSSPDEMGYSLSYFDGDYAGITSNPAIASISGSGLDAASPDLYNGNIRHMITSIRQFMSGSNTPHAMAYQYDQLNRIRSSEMYSNINLGTNSWNSGGSGNAEYKEVFTYDHNGNIILQKRNGLTPTAMDDLHYYYYTTAVTPTTYDPQSGTPTDATNKLAYVTDAVSSGNYGDDIDNQSANNYSYDKIGQLISDAQEEIDAIEWTVYGKIRSVTRTTGSIKDDLEFQYDAMGNRMVKIAKERAVGGQKTQEYWTYTYYVRDASGNVMSTYERTFTVPATTYDDILTLKEQNLYGSSRIGVRNADLQLVSKNYTFSFYNGQLLVGTPVTQTTTATPLTSFEHVTGQKAYELSNHLGNVLAVVSDARQPINGTGSMSGVVVSYSAMVVSATDYSAFGAPMAGRTYSSPSYRYGFNGQEKDDEVIGSSGAIYTATFWEYDARLGRRWNIDPKFLIDMSPYSVFIDNPLKLKDLLGDFPTTPEAAAMAAHVYGDQTDAILIGGWHVSARDFGPDLVKVDPVTGFKSQVYERTVKGVTEYVYATAGTEDLIDAKADIVQPLGCSDQYTTSMNNAKILSVAMNGTELNFTGHSLGGGLAAANAYATGLNATTFNAAGVSPLTIEENPSSEILACIIKGEVLNEVQNSEAALPDVNGTRFYIPPADPGLNTFERHSVDNFLIKFGNTPVHFTKAQQIAMDKQNAPKPKPNIGTPNMTQGKPIEKDQIQSQTPTQRPQ